jgi:hypothetical protein
MRVSSSNIPQADKLDNVISLILEAGRGAETDAKLIAGIPTLNTPRQGRYYRNAAEILGFIENHRNHARLTMAGLEFLKNPTLQNPGFIAAVLKIDIIQQLLPLFEIRLNGLTRQELTDYTIAFSAPTGPSVIPRRVSTILSWLRDLQVIKEIDGLYYLDKSFTDHLSVLEVADLEQPLFPVTADLKEYSQIETRIAGAKEVITIYKDAARLERANIAHQHLVNLVASRITASGCIAKSNALIDLATASDQDFIFEMKSMGDTNVRSQIRKGLSQLYEYRYLQHKSEAMLVLVMEKQLPKKEQWMIDYLEQDRAVSIIWNGDGELHGTAQAHKKLKFLRLT